MTITILPPDMSHVTLDIDEELYDHAANKMPVHTRVERRIVHNLYKHLQANGWIIAAVFDSEETTEVADCKAMMELVFNLDECSLRVRPSGTRADLIGVEYGIWIILGNGSNGQDMIADHTYGRNDDFNEVMNAFDPEVYA